MLREGMTMVLAGSVLLVLATVVVIAAAFCQWRGVRLTTPVNVALAAVAVLLGAAGLVALAAPAPIAPPPPDPLSDAEKTGTARLHTTTVQIFIDRPNFGIRRMPLRMDDVVKTEKAPPKKDAPEKDPPAPTADPEQPGKKPHYPVQPTADDGKDTFLGRFDHFPTDDKKELWKVRKVQLVGLVMHKEPVVYVTDKMPDMKEPKEVPTRALDDFEKKALEAIRGGENLKAEKRDKEIRMVGAIYAGQRCLTCHAQKGQLLGAFSYQLERVAAEAPKEKGAEGPRIP